MISREVKIINKLGLHARASSKLVELASSFKSNITISKDNKSANAKSLMSVMMLAAANGSIILIHASGEDQELAIDALCNMINSKFGEAD